MAIRTSLHCHFFTGATISVHKAVAAPCEGIFNIIGFIPSATRLLFRSSKQLPAKVRSPDICLYLSQQIPDVLLWYENFSLCD
nr:hypothetical protein [uncultured Chryseobacterium sp.]